MQDEKNTIHKIQNISGISNFLSMRETIIWVNLFYRQSLQRLS